MILATARERLEGVLRQPGMERALGVLRAGGAETALCGLHEVAKGLVVAQLMKELRRPGFLVVETNGRAEALAETIRFFSGVLSSGGSQGVAVLPAFDVHPWQGRPPHADILERRAATLHRLASGEVSLVIAPLAAALWRYQAAVRYRELGVKLSAGQDAGLADLLAHLRGVGYARAEMAELPGQFAVRGGIVDVFSPEAARPVRIELLGDTIESLREFDPRTQRSVAPVRSTTILPLTEKSAVGTEADAESSADAYPSAFPNGAGARGESSLFELSAQSLRPLLFLDEPQVLREAAARQRAEAAENYEKHGRADSPEPGQLFWTEQEWEAQVQGTSRVHLEQLALDTGAENRFELPSRPCSKFHGDVVACMGEMKSQLAGGGTIFLTAASTGERERLADICREYELPYVLGETEAIAEGITSESSMESARLVLLRAPFGEGVAFPGAKLTIYGNADLFDVAPAAERPKRKSALTGFLSDFTELKPGDYVVHIDHGIGQFEGLRQIESDGKRGGEFMLLRYAEDARLYVPLERMDLVQSYRSMEGAAPVLDRLGGVSWGARKGRVKKSLEDMAERLAELYAQRRTAKGFAFSKDTPWQKEFEDAFEFEETADQVAAIAAIKADMERGVPMDRLLCGDVGYGKTEVAMRAALKAICDGKQVALLAPTTVLAFQHFETFKKRFAAFPAKIEMLSRFRSAAEQKVALEGLEAGRVDMVIGTHRLLSKDVKFHDLGLMIVDEEQRFGVSHKERLKEIRKDVHALSLSATPIPRTLHMSLAGLRDMSLIETPPKDRLAIQTVVAPFREDLVKRAIEDELARDGQVYVIHNRVESIYSLAAMVSKLVPKARVVVGHGQMGEKALEKVMLQFIRDEADVLVATTIVENGLDIPRANTILINRADRLGLSELYQLRGRVGRSHQRAYAYLMVPPEATLTDIARRRLAAMKEFSELGAGFRIAALDLELRGAGNLLGREQHGHVSAIGFDLYCQMLERAVARIKGEEATSDLRTTLSLGLDVRIPQEYIPGENLRLRTYKRISAIATEAEQKDVRRELEDRFGPVPPSVDNLLEYAALKSLSERLRIAAIERQGTRISMRFHPETQLDPARVVAVVRSRSGIRLDPSGVLWLEAGRGEPVLPALRNVLLGLQGQG
jgi:transcription-repair coupling factor (superfamily II helicase)